MCQSTVLSILPASFNIILPITLITPILQQNRLGHRKVNPRDLGKEPDWDLYLVTLTHSLPHHCLISLSLYCPLCWPWCFNWSLWDLSKGEKYRCIVSSFEKQKDGPAVLQDSKDTIHIMGCVNGALWSCAMYCLHRHMQWPC